MPERELELFNRLVMQDDSEFEDQAKELKQATPTRCQQIANLRSFMRGKLAKGNDFKAMVTALSDQRRHVDQAYKWV